jgi:radical SAM protein with 4Fe4S-binding SPASM domain
MARTRIRRAAWRALHPLYRRLETSVHPLRYLFLEITRRCNLACKHCGSDCGSQPVETELSTDAWVSLVQRIPSMFPDPLPFLVITGGEPLCHPELPRILDAAHRGGLRMGVVTNGWMLDQTRLSMLLDHGVSSCTVSLDGLQASHDWLRGRDGSFDRAMRAIELLAGSTIGIFDVVTCTNPRNLGELDRMGDLLARAGVRRWRLFSIFPKGRAKENPAVVLDDAGVRTLLGWIARTRAAGTWPRLNVEFCCEGCLPPDVDRAVRDEPYFCRAGIAIGSVLADGSIAACPNITETLVQGNVRDDELREVWERRFERFRDRTWMRQGPCAACGEWSRCLGNSMHLWDEEHGRTCLCHNDVCRPK